MMDLSNPYNLTPGELEVAKLFIRGMSAVGCANELYLSKRTVEHNLKCIYRKLALKEDPMICKKVVAANRIKDLYGVR